MQTSGEDYMHQNKKNCSFEGIPKSVLGVIDTQLRQYCHILQVMV